MGESGVKRKHTDGEKPMEHTETILDAVVVLVKSMTREMNMRQNAEIDERLKVTVRKELE